MERRALELMTGEDEGGLNARLLHYSSHFVTVCAT